MQVFLIHAGAREQSRQLADRLRWHDCEPTHIWSSPRALETAQILAAVLMSECAIEAHAELEAAHDTLPALRELAPDACVVIVGHEPMLSTLGALLVGGGDFAAFARAEAARVDDDELRWRFHWNADAPVLRP